MLEKDPEEAEDQVTLVDPVSVGLLIVIACTLVLSLWLPAAGVIVGVTVANYGQIVLTYFLGHHPFILFMCLILGTASLTANGLSEAARLRFINTFDLSFNTTEIYDESIITQQISEIIKDSVHISYADLDHNIE